MSFDVIVTETFEKKLKQLTKKYVSLPKGLSSFIDDMAYNHKWVFRLERNVTKSGAPFLPKDRGKKWSESILKVN